MSKQPRKRMDLDTIGAEEPLTEPEAPAAPPAVVVADAPAARPAGQGNRAHVKQLTLYLPHPVYDQLREIAFHEKVKMHALVMEGLDRLFADRGQEGVKQLAGIS